MWLGVKDANNSEEIKYEPKNNETIEPQPTQKAKLDSEKEDRGPEYVLPHQSPNWPLIKEKLQKLIDSSPDPELLYSTLTQFKKINKYDDGEKNNYNLLRKAVSSFDDFFTETLPFMANLALKVEMIFPEGLPLCRRSKNKIVFLSKQQCACLLFNMFFCTVLDQKNSNLPKSFNLAAWHHGSSACNQNREPSIVAKIQCFINYAQRMKAKLPLDEMLSFERVYLDPRKKYDQSFWSESTKLLCPAKLKEGSIQDAHGALQIDFANKFLGGGVLRTGCVQEEIAFAVAPEHMCGILFFESMSATEAINIKGAQEYSAFKGYGDTFRFAGDLEITGVPYDEYKRMEITTVAMDALSFGSADPADQFIEANILRELNKALVGFRGPVLDCTEADKKRDVATGKWGCGAFKGNPQLKFVIQWLACSKVQRKMLFYPFGDKTLDSATELIKKYSECSIGELFMLVLKFAEKEASKKDTKLFDYLLK